MLADIETDAERLECLDAFGRNFVVEGYSTEFPAILGTEAGYVDDGASGNYAARTQDYRVLVREIDRASYGLEIGVVLVKGTERYKIIEHVPDKTGMLELHVEKQLDTG